MISIQKERDPSASRAFDVREIIRRSPVAKFPAADKVLTQCLHRSSDVYQGLVDGQIACVWGLIPPTLLSNSAYLWLLTTDLVEQHKFLFVRHSQRWMEEALLTYPVIIGDMASDDPIARRWLEWLGAKFGATIEGRHTFIIKKKVLQ